MKHPDNQFTIEEVERLCQLYQDCQLSILEETELESRRNRVGVCVDA